MKAILVLVLLTGTAWSQVLSRITFLSGNGEGWKRAGTFGTFVGTELDPTPDSDFNVFVDGQHLARAEGRHYFFTAILEPGTHFIVATTKRDLDDARRNARLQMRLAPGEHRFVLTQMYYYGFTDSVRFRYVDMREVTCQQAESIAHKYRPLAAKYVIDRDFVEVTPRFPDCTSIDIHTRDLKSAKH